jgi:hypothetical protein
VSINWRRPDGEVTYLRFAFAGDSGEQIAGPGTRRRHRARVLDDAGRNRASQARHRSPLVLACVQDWLAGVRMPSARTRAAFFLMRRWLAALVSCSPAVDRERAGSPARRCASTTVAWMNRRSPSPPEQFARAAHGNGEGTDAGQ